MGFAAPFYGVHNAIFQEKVKPEYLGRVFSLLTSAASLAMLGLVISGPLAKKFGVEKWFIICGIGIIIVAFSACFLPSSMEIDAPNVDIEQVISPQTLRKVDPAKKNSEPGNP